MGAWCEIEGPAAHHWIPPTGRWVSPLASQVTRASMIGIDGSGRGFAQQTTIVEHLERITLMPPIEDSQHLGRGCRDCPGRIGRRDIVVHKRRTSMNCAVSEGIKV